MSSLGLLKGMYSSSLCGSGSNAIALRYMLFAFVIILLSAGSAAAAVNSLQADPTTAPVGTIITISGTANPNEQVPLSVTFSVNPQVSTNGVYEYDPGTVTIPSSSGTYTITAQTVEDLTISKDVLGIFTLSITQTASAPISSGTSSTPSSGGIATMSQSLIPAGDYDLMVSGNARGQSSVMITFTAAMSVTANGSGNFEYSYDTDNVPPGIFTVKAGNAAPVEVTLVAKRSTLGSSPTGQAQIVDLVSEEQPLPSPAENVSEALPSAPEGSEPQPTSEPVGFWEYIKGMINNILNWLGFD